MRATRIGIDAGLACSEKPTGVETFARSLLGELLRREQTNIEYTLYLPPTSDPGIDIPKGVTTRRRPDVNTAIKTPWLIAQTWRDDLDLLYTFGHVLPRGCRGKTAITVYDTAYDEFPECYPPAAAMRIHAEVLRATRRADAVITLSEATRTCLIRDYGLLKERVFVSHAGSRQFHQRSTGAPALAVTREADIKQPYLLCVGRIDRRKNIEAVISAYRATLLAGIACGGLVIAGPDDSGSVGVMAQIKREQVPGERIVLTGYVSDDDLHRLYQDAIALVYPSLSEGFGLPVLEAMSCGTAVITSNTSCFPEVAGNAALLVDPLSVPDITDAIRRVLTDAELRASLSALGKQRSLEFTWSKSAERVERALLTTAGRANGGCIPHA